MAGTKISRTLLWLLMIVFCDHSGGSRLQTRIGNLEDKVHYLSKDIDHLYYQIVNCSSADICDKIVNSKTSNENHEKFMDKLSRASMVTDAIQHAFKNEKTLLRAESATVKNELTRLKRDLANDIETIVDTRMAENKFDPDVFLNRVDMKLEAFSDKLAEQIDGLCDQTAILEKIDVVKNDVADAKKVLSAGVKLGLVSKWKQFGESYYYYGYDGATWENANSICESMGAYLLKVDNAAEERFIHDVFPADYVWIGGSDRYMEGEWRWDKTDERMTEGYQNWIRGEPNNARDNEDCAIIIMHKGGWVDTSCGITQTFVCEANIEF